MVGPGFTAKKVSEMKTGATGFSDRKTSHKEIEEALAGGLNKVRLINILIYVSVDRYRVSEIGQLLLY